MTHDEPTPPIGPQSPAISLDDLAQMLATYYRADVRIEVKWGPDNVVIALARTPET